MKSQIFAAVVALLGLVALVTASAAQAFAPDPGGDEYSPIKGPPAGKLLGFSGIRQKGDPNPASTAALVAGIRGNATRTVLHWQTLEPRRDYYQEAEFARYEQLYNALRARGIEPIFMIQYAPAWARDPGPAANCGAYDACHDPPAVSMLGEWQEFVAEVARRFPAAAIEVWNEPNYAGQWESGVDPARYAQLLAAADAAVGAVNPATPVYMGGLGTIGKQGGIGAARFLAEAYQASPSLKGHTDAINFHVYPGPSLGADSSFAEPFENLRAARDAAGDRSTPLLITELGATTTGGAAATEREQADRLVRASRKVLTMPDTLGALLYTLADRDEYAKGDPERGYGVVRASPGLLGSAIDPKTAYCALRSAAANPYLGCPPETTITGGPPEFGTSGNVEFTFRSAEALVLGHECSLDGAAFRSCLSPARYTGLAPGRHWFRVRARGLLNTPDPFPPRVDFGVEIESRGLEARARPRSTGLRSGRARNFDVRVSSPRAALPTADVSVCLKANRRLVKNRSAACLQVGELAPGGAVRATFRLVPRRRAEGRRLRLRFVARGERTAKAVAEARLEVVRRGKRR